MIKDQQERQEYKVLLELQDHRVCKDCKENKDIQVQTAAQDQLVLRALRVRRENKEQQARLVLMVQRDLCQLDRLDHKVQME